MQTARVGQRGSPKDVSGRGVCSDMLYTHSPPCSLTGRSACRREQEWERRAHDARKALMQVRPIRYLSCASAACFGWFTVRVNIWVYPLRCSRERAILKVARLKPRKDKS